MIERLVIVFAMFTVVLSSCTHVNGIGQIGRNFTEASNEKQILFFSDENNIYEESDYYDALLEFKKNFPDVWREMEVIPPEEKQTYRTYNIVTPPALIIIKDSQVVAEIVGPHTKDQIVTVINQTFEN
ncbi:hypothetical protein EJF36_08335 [Bacillus sp. HMF5848]|uniref:hypothetical protein n=1 Tax=Bacillus sp. HMF5848 TaxID=2495421 RepID=UPI000F77FBDE|nr:hypothetical protein [Bacillus sp. HMF5848]RSK26872.1 hypothetical protein EJF36_08335 [Bacillus sp. HMF5848]